MAIYVIKVTYLGKNQTDVKYILHVQSNFYGYYQYLFEVYRPIESKFRLVRPVTTRNKTLYLIACMSFFKNYYKSFIAINLSSVQKILL